MMNASENTASSSNHNNASCAGPSSDLTAKSSRSNQSFQSQTSSETTSCEDASKKIRLSGDERLCRSRERNRLHAKKTRDRKRTQTANVQMRINALYEEVCLGARLRQMVDERYTASSLLGLRNEVSEHDASLMPASHICPNSYEDALKKNGWIRDVKGHLILSDGSNAGNKRARRIGKFSNEERELMRRERNRMHAKKTRDRKKNFAEQSEKIISEMESEISSLREYLRSVHAITDEEFTASVQNTHQIIPQYEEEEEGEEEDEVEEDDDATVTDNEEMEIVDGDVDLIK